VPDFVHLSRAARLAPGPDTVDRLWSAMFELPAWHFVKAPSPSGWLPFAGYVNGQRCVLGFTEAVRADGYARFAALVLAGVDSPVLSMTPEAVIQLVPRLRSWGIAGMVVDTGPDSFYAPLDALFQMRSRFRGARPAPGIVQAPALAPTMLAPLGGRPLSVDTMLALPAWHVVTTRDDPSFPDLAFQDTELVAQIYSSAQALARRGKPGEQPPPTAVMAPRAALSLLSDIELVGIVRFDAELDIPFVDLKLRADREP
jgi:hypothetical protein